MEFDLDSFPTLQEAMNLLENRKNAQNSRGRRMAPQWQKPPRPKFLVQKAPSPKFLVQKPYIPGEVVKNILSRLPIKSLLRFKCANKYWKSIISDPDFVLANDRSKAVFTTEDRHSICFHFVNNEAVVEKLPWRRKETFVRSDPYEDYEYCFLGGSCNGLLLVVLGISLFLWNPSTRYMRKVLELNRLDDYRVVSGLCFDSFADDYKVVMGLAHQSPEYGGAFVMVSSLKEKQWREVLFPYRVSSIESGPVVNGFLHWKVKGRSEYSRSFYTPQKIVAFDPKTDEFRELPMPQPKNRDGNLVLGLGVLGGCLCMAHWDNESDHSEGNAEVLAMKEYGVKESWTTMFNISNLDIKPLYTSLRPLLFMSNGEVLLGLENEILIYHPTEMTYKKVEVKNIARHGFGDLYVESLASPTGCEWDKKQHGSHTKEIIRLGYQDTLYSDEDTAEEDTEN